MREDYYQLLDVEQDAPAKDIKAAYHRLAFRYHPDHNVDDAAAEERFKLVAEAYRTLGVPERRREYDNWLHLHNLYHSAPELAGMSATGRTPIKPFHFSSQRARERSERRSGRREEARAPRRRSILPRRSSKVNTWLFIGFYALLFFNLLPIFLRHMFADDAPRAARAAAVEPEEVSETDARMRLLRMEQDWRRRAVAGEAEAQYQLALYLFNKSARGRGKEGTPPTLLRRAASEGYRQEALDWFERAASQEHEPAQRFLRNLCRNGQMGAETSLP